MLEEQRQNRQERAERQIATLSYEHLKLTRQVEACQRRMREIDLAVTRLEGGLLESERCRADISTAAAVEAAKNQQEE